MKTKEFIQLLKNHQGKSLYFEYAPGNFVRPDYHLTEVKNLTYDTVDCGGIQNKWQETHIQLWENEVPEPNHSLTTTKALKIIEAVEKVRTTYKDAEVKFEYENQNFHAAVLPVFDVNVSSDKIIFQLGKNHTTCKAKDRASTPEEKEMACCGPVTEPKTETVAQACTPESDCC